MKKEELDERQELNDEELRLITGGKNEQNIRCKTNDADINNADSQDIVSKQMSRSNIEKANITAADNGMNKHIR